MKDTMCIVVGTRLHVVTTAKVFLGQFGVGFARLLLLCLCSSWIGIACHGRWAVVCTDRTIEALARTGIHTTNAVLSCRADRTFVAFRWSDFVGTTVGVGDSRIARTFAFFARSLLVLVLVVNWSNARFAAFGGNGGSRIESFVAGGAARCPGRRKLARRAAGASGSVARVPRTITFLRLVFSGGASRACTRFQDTVAPVLVPFCTSTSSSGG